MSIKNTGNSSQKLFDINKGFDHSQIPFVQALIEEPTLKPFFFKKTLFNKKDFPVRYFPIKLIIPIFE